MNNILNSFTINELRVLRAIYEHGPISRVRLAEGLHLTRAGITVIIKKLAELDLIAEAGKGASDAGRGRRQVLLALNPDNGMVVSLHIALHYVTIALVNINGKIITKHRIDFPDDNSPKLVLSRAVEHMSDMIARVPAQRILGIGVALPGIVDSAAGTVREKSVPAWHNYPIKQYLQKKLDLPILMENDVKTLTLGEYQFGSGKHVKDMVCLWLEDGIGAGIIIDNRLLRGVTFSSGEIGFSQFIMGQPVKNSLLIVGHPQFWGDILSFTNIKNAVQRGLQDGWTSGLSADASIDDFVEAILSNDPLAVYIYRLLCDVLGTVTCNLIYSFNPKVMLLSGPLFHRLPNLTADILERLHHAYLRTPIEAVQLKTSALGEDGISIGCAALVLEQLFKSLESHSIQL